VLGSIVCKAIWWVVSFVGKFGVLVSLVELSSLCAYKSGVLSSLVYLRV